MFWGRNFKTQLANTHQKANKLSRADMPPEAAGIEMVRDGYHVCLQGQMVMREHGVSATASAKVNFGAIIAPKLLKLEVGASLQGEALGKRTILVMRGRTKYNDSPSPAGGVETPKPILISCMDGWKFVGGGSIGCAVGVGGKFGSAAVGIERAGYDKPMAANPEAEFKDPTATEYTPGKVAIDLVKAEAEYFAGLEAAASGTFQHYYASDMNPYFTALDRSSNANTVALEITSVLKEGTVKAAIKVKACQLISSNRVFGSPINYHKRFGRHTSSETIMSRLKAGIAKLPDGLKKTEAKMLMEQLGPYVGKSSVMHGLTHIIISGREGSYSAGVGARVQGAACIPMLGLEVGAKVEANLARVAGSGKTINLRFQAPCGHHPDHRTQVYYQNYDISYRTFEFAALEVSADFEAKAFGHEFSLAGYIDEQLSGGSEQERSTDIKALIKSLGKWWGFGERTGGLSVAVAAGTAATMSYKGVSLFWNRVNDRERVWHKAGPRATSMNSTTDAQAGTGYVQGATYTLETLANTSDVLVSLKALIGQAGIDKFYEGTSELDESDFPAGVDADKLIGPINGFHKTFAGFAEMIKATPQQFGEFIEAFGDLAHGMAGEIGGGAGVLLESCFSVPTAKRGGIVNVEVERSGKEDSFTIASTTNDNIMAAIPADAKPDSIRLRYRMQDSYDRSMSLPLGIAIHDVVDVGLTLKNVWNMEVEGIPTFFEKLFANPGLESNDQDKVHSQIVPPPLLFRC